MEIDILTLFPEYFEGPFGVSILKRAIERSLITIRTVQLRDFSDDPHKRVDDRPYGGGPGMLLKPEPLMAAIRSLRKENSKVVYLSPQGKPLNAAICREYAKIDHLILVCGHYEGIDERVIQLAVDEEISIGDFVLTSGCPAAAILVDAMARFIPGVLGHPESAESETFSHPDGFDHPQYTRPALFEGIEVPEVLQNGDHLKIMQWRQQEAKKKCLRVRPDLYYLVEKT